MPTIRKTRRIVGQKWRAVCEEADILREAVLDHLAAMGTPWLAMALAFSITGLTLYGVVKVFAALSA